MAIATRKYMPRRTKSQYGRVGTPAYTKRRSSPALKRLKEELGKAKKSASMARRKNKANFFSGSGIKPMAVATICAGGAAAGAAKVYMPQIAGFNTALVAGAGLVAASMYMNDDTLAPALGAIGAGMLCSWSSDFSAMTIIDMQAAQ